MKNTLSAVKNFFNHTSIDSDNTPKNLVRISFTIALYFTAGLIIFAVINQKMNLVYTNIATLTYYIIALYSINKYGKYKEFVLGISIILPMILGFRSLYEGTGISTMVLSMILLSIIGAIVFSPILEFVLTTYRVSIFLICFYFEKNSMFGFEAKYEPVFYIHWGIITVITHYVTFLITKILNDLRLQNIKSVKVQKELKELLLRTMSHDLSTPLMVLMGSIKSIERKHSEISTIKEFQSIKLQIIQL